MTTMQCTPTVEGQSVSDSDDDLPATQPVSSVLLRSVTAYVEVRTNGENRSRGVKCQLKKLGANVVHNFTRHVTHVVFKEGKLSTYQKAVSRKNIHLVSALWVDDCKTSLTKVPEKRYPPVNIERYKFPSEFNKIKRLHRFQAEIDEEKVERLKLKQKNAIVAPEPTVYESTTAHREVNKLPQVPSPRPPRSKSPSEITYVKALCAIAGDIDPKYNEYINCPASPVSSDEEREPTPLAVRLMRRFVQSPLNTNNITPLSLNRSNNNLLHCEGSTSHDTKTPENLEGLSTGESAVSNKTPTVDGVSKSLAAVALTTPLMTHFITPVSTNRRKSLRHKILSSNSKVINEESSSVNSYLSQPRSCMQVDVNILNSTTRSTTSTQKKRRLYTVARQHDLPQLIPIEEDDFGTCQKALHFTSEIKENIKSSIDMELTDCIPSDIVQMNSLQMKIRFATDKLTEEHPIEKTESGSRGYKSRRSSMHFKTPKLVKCQDGVMAAVTRLPTVVCTSLLKDDVELITSAVGNLGGYEMEEKVSNRTSHVVSSYPIRRTLNLLRGIVHGCWIVKKDWVLDSLEAGKWLDEEKYEGVSFSPAVQQCRVEKLSFGPAYQLRLFSECGLVFVGRNTSPSSKDLVELITLCGGQIASKARSANIIVGEITRDSSIACVTEKWILDTVTSAELRPTQDYVMVRGRRTL